MTRQLSDIAAWLRDKPHSEAQWEEIAFSMRRYVEEYGACLEHLEELQDIVWGEYDER